MIDILSALSFDTTNPVSMGILAGFIITTVFVAMLLILGFILMVATVATSFYASKYGKPMRWVGLAIERIVQGLIQFVFKYIRKYTRGV